MPKIKKRRKRRSRSSESEDYRIHMSKASTFSGVRFPDGSKRIVFNIWCEMGGNFAATRRRLKKEKLLDGGRVPSNRTIQKWAEENQWETLRSMVDDGILEYLEAQDDPDIQEAIRTDAAVFKVLEKMRSQLYVGLLAKKSPLFPKNNRDAVNTLKYVEEGITRFQERFDQARDRGAGIDATDDVGDEKIIHLADRLAEKGLEPTQENLAREAMIHMKEKEAN